MKFALFREIKKGKRKFLLEWNQAEILTEIEHELKGAGKALENVIERFKKESIKIP